MSRRVVWDTRLRNRSLMQINPILKRQIKARLTLVERQDTKIATADEGLARKGEILRSIPGLDPIAAALILTFLPEVGTLDRKQAKASPGVRYMPALVVMRFNPDLWAKYAARRSAGKPAKPAIMALMRKLPEMANARIKADRLWVEKHP